MQAEPRTFRRSWRSQARILGAGLGFILFLGFGFRMTAHGHLTGWAYLQAAVVFALVFAETGFWLHRPTLSLDGEGVRLDALSWGWTYRWRDIQQVETFDPRSAPPLAGVLGLRLRAGVAPQNPLAEAVWRSVCGCPAVIGDGWDAPLPQLRESLERFRACAAEGS